MSGLNNKTHVPLCNEDCIGHGTEAHNGHSHLSVLDTMALLPHRECLAMMVGHTHNNLCLRA